MKDLHYHPIVSFSQDWAIFSPALNVKHVRITNYVAGNSLSSLPRFSTEWGSPHLGVVGNFAVFPLLLSILFHFAPLPLQKSCCCWCVSVSAHSREFMEIPLSSFVELWVFSFVILVSVCGFQKSFEEIQKLYCWRDYTT